MAHGKVGGLERFESDEVEMRDGSEPDEQLSLRSLSMSILTGGCFQVATPVAQELLAHLLNWLSLGDYGGIVTGRPRLGKTSAARWAIKQLPKTLGFDVPWTEISFRTHVSTSERGFFRYLLRRADHDYKSGTAGDLRDRLTELLISRASQAGSMMYILFIDEAQAMDDIHYEFLLNISNEMDSAKCRLFCLLAGQNELLKKKAELMGKDKEQIVARFMLRSFEFRGLCSEAEIAFCLEGFNNLVWPQNAATRLPQIYVSQLCAQGFRLQDLSQEFFARFQEKWERQTQVIVPMWYLTRAMLFYLAEQQKSRKEIFDKRLLDQSVEQSGFAESLQMQASKPTT